MKKCILLTLLLRALMPILANDNMLERLYSNEDFARINNWNSVCSSVRLEENGDNIVIKAFDKEMSGDSLFIVELYSTGPHQSPLISFWILKIKSDSILVVESDSSSLRKISIDDVSCDYKLFSIIQQRNFELLENWNRKVLETVTDTPSSKYFVSMFYKIGHTLCLRKWIFYKCTLKRRLMRDHLLDRKSKGLDYYYPDFDDLMKDD